jgi:hypothetical protein
MTLDSYKNSIMRVNSLPALTFLQNQQFILSNQRPSVNSVHFREANQQSSHEKLENSLGQQL